MAFDSGIFPTELLAEIFSHIKSDYSTFRRLNKVCSTVKTPYDGWDALIDQGYKVKISESTIRWYLHGKHHRGKDLPAVEWCDGNKEWWRNNERHRDGNLPAFVGGGVYPYRSWFRHGKRHRDPGPEGDLPAVVWSDGWKEYYKDGIRITIEPS